MHRSRAPLIAPDTFFAAQFSAGYTTNMSGFDLRQAQPVRASRTTTTTLPPTGRYFFVIGRPERFLLMRSTSAALRLAPTTAWLSAKDDVPWPRGNSRPRTEALTQPFRLRPGTTKAGPMPPHEGLGLDDREDLQDRRKPAMQLDQKPAIMVRQPDATMQPAP